MPTSANADSESGPILVLGDSISAAYGIPLEQGWVALLEEKLEQHSAPYAVVNASISGETSAGGLRRLSSLLQRYQPDIVIIELGGNELFDKIAADRTDYINVVIENLYKEHNASAVLRTCDCYGIKKLHVIENENQYKVNREIALGAGKWVDVETHVAF